MDVCPESLGTMLEYEYIERGLFVPSGLTSNGVTLFLRDHH